MNPEEKEANRGRLEQVLRFHGPAEPHIILGLAGASRTQDNLATGGGGF
jgi:hypothetical protein